MSLLLIVPFVLILLAIAVLPLVVPHWWEHNTNKAVVAFILGSGRWLSPAARRGRVAPCPAHAAGVYGIYGAPGVALHDLRRYCPARRPAGDAGSERLFPGTRGHVGQYHGHDWRLDALIRPLLQTNAERRYVAHTVVFFIFLVSNIGGCLTPLGDPPLFLGYLRGVPFTWTLSLWPVWLAMVVLLLVVYGVWDTILHARESPQALQLDRTHIEPLRLQGSLNFLFLALVVTAVALVPAPWRMLLMLAATGGSLLLGGPAARRANQFTYAPIIEVAVLFLGIFLTMAPALEFLDQYGASLGVNTPPRFFWATGVFSSFLDNAPTYVTFFEAARAQASLALGGTTVAGVPDSWLMAISLGAVFMGANTYIGNGPNFMVKAVAEEAGIKMPSFFGYMAYSGLILMPLFVGMTLLMF